MALPVSIGLCSPYVVISASASELSITVVKVKDVIFGTVEQIYAGCEQAVVGASVMFKNDTATRILISGTSYYVVDVKNVFFNEL